MGSLASLIDTTLIEENTIDLNEFINTYKDKEILKESLFEYSVFNNFDSSRWVFFYAINQSKVYFDFKMFDTLVDKKVIEEMDISLIKCFLIDKLEDGLTPLTIKGYLTSVYSLIYITDNFNKNKIYRDNILIMDMLLSDEKPYAITSKGYLIDYINFLESVNCITEEHLDVLSYLYDTKLLDKSSNTRSLPQTKDILSFDFYLKKFFKETEPGIERDLYKPVLLWWKITSVIPLRASEFAYKLKRDCLLEKDGKFYLKVNRVKVRPDKLRKRKKRPSIPILNKLEISKEIYDMVLDYIDCTSFDTETETLFSYMAYKLAWLKLYNPQVTDIDHYFSTHTNKIKKYTEHFNSNTLQDIIDLFYDKIIFGKYENNIIEERLIVGDTRHLAFCSLMLQGVSPIEIAMLGGHTSLESQDAYIGHARYYIDSEILNYIANRTLKPEINNKELKKIILSKPYTPDKSIVECFPTDDNIGYCTVDVEAEVCDNNNRPCIFCSKWWCYPSVENFVKAKKYLNEDCLGPLMKQLETEEKFLARLLKTAKVVNVNGLLELEKSDDEEIKSQVMKIKSTANEILFIQKILLEISSSKELK